MLCQILGLTFHYSFLLPFHPFLLFFALQRENALASADFEEEETHQKQGQKRKMSQPGVKAADKQVLDDVDYPAVNQRKKIQINPEEERLKNERTVFVGNLPVTCNKKVSVQSVHCEDSEKEITRNSVYCPFTE